MGAISTACVPASTARSIASTATSVLPAPTSPLQQPQHAAGGGEIRVDRVQGAELRRRGRVAEPRQRRRPQRAVATECAAAGGADPPAHQAHGELAREQLVIGEPQAGGARLACVVVGGRLQAPDRRGEAGPALAGEQRRVDPLGDRVGQAGDRGGHRAAHRGLADAGHQRPARLECRDARGGGGRLDMVGVGHPQPAAVIGQPARDHHAGAGRELAQALRLEQRELHRAGAVGRDDPPWLARVLGGAPGARSRPRSSPRRPAPPRPGTAPPAGPAGPRADAAAGRTAWLPPRSAPGSAARACSAPRGGARRGGARRCFAVISCIRGGGTGGGRYMTRRGWTET